MKKTLFLNVIFALVSASAFAGIGYNGQCPDLSGTYGGSVMGEPNQSSFTRTTAIVDGNQVMAFDGGGGPLWIIDGKARSNEGWGTIQFTCSHNVLHKITSSPGPNPDQPITLDQTYAIRADGSLVINGNIILTRQGN